MAVKVNKVKCTGCGKCVAVCPTAAINIIKEKAVIISEECIHCETCVDECPKFAISAEQAITSRPRSSSKNKGSRR